jgi:2-(1,2-epoxy-1,2-dihydrophenyl)acetyl-CoA isomerase
MSERVSLRVDGAVAWITLCAGERRNAMDEAWVQQWSDVTARCAADDGLEVVAVTAEGPHFCVGGDLDAFVSYGDDLAARIAAMVGWFHDGVHRLRAMEVPIVVAVQGLAAGGGLSLVAAGDLVLASSAARFASAYTSSGLTPDGGLTWTLPRAVGARQAFRLIATNPVLDAEQARQIGLVSEVVAPGELERATRDAVGAMVALPPGTLRAATGLLRHSEGATLAQQLAAEAEAIVGLAGTATTQAVVRSFVDRAGRATPR